METHVLFRGRLPGKRAIQAKLREIGLPFTFAPVTGSLEDQDGYMPMRYRRADTGVEFSVDDRSEVFEPEDDPGGDMALDRVGSFRWGGDAVEGAAGMSCAAAIAALTGGMVLDEFEDRLVDADTAATMARALMETLQPAVIKRVGTRKADFRRYLKPLLEKRPDLVLDGRRLCITPCRHLLRGVWFDPSPSDHTCFYLYWFVQPLAYDSIDQDRSATLYVTDPHFLQLLHHELREVLGKVGRVTSFDDYRRALGEADRCDRETFAAILLGEGQAAADAYLDATLPRDAPPPDWVAEYRAAQAEGPEAVFRPYHEREARSVGGFEVDPGWQKSPFPGQLPPEERAAAVDPAFDTSPWVAFDPGWRSEMPRQPGETKFAEKIWSGDEGRFLVGEISAEEAERRAAAFEGYVVARRMEDGALLTISHIEHRSKHELKEEYQSTYSSHGLSVEMPSGGKLYAKFRERPAATGVDTYLLSVELRVDERKTAIFLDSDDRQINIWEADGTYRKQDYDPASNRLAEIGPFTVRSWLDAAVEALRACGYGNWREDGPASVRS